MITIKAIFTDGVATPESIPNNKNLGSNFDGENFIFFESEDEKIEYYKQFETPTE